MLLWAQPSRGACSLLRNGSWRHCSGARAWGTHGPGCTRGSEWDRIPWQKLFFYGAMTAAYECSFPFWCWGAVAPQEAEEVTFWPPFCLSYLSGASQTPSWCLCIQGWVLPTAEHTQPCEHPLTPRPQGRLDCLGLFAPRRAQVMSKIHTCLRQVVSVQQKYAFSTSVCSDNAECFCKNLQNERTQFLCMGFHYFNLWQVCFFT